MLKNKSYKTKFRLCLLGFGLLFFIIYFLNIKKTFALKSTNSQIKGEYINSQNNPLALKELENKLDELNNILGSKYECSELPEELVKFSSFFASNGNITLVELTETKSEERENMNFCSLSIILSGGFNELVKYIYSLETLYNIGRISSVSFHTSNKRNKKEELFVEIHIQNVEIN